MRLTNSWTYPGHWMSQIQAILELFRPEWQTPVVSAKWHDLFQQLVEDSWDSYVGIIIASKNLWANRQMPQIDKFHEKTKTFSGISNFWMAWSKQTRLFIQCCLVTPKKLSRNKKLQSMLSQNVSFFAFMLSTRRLRSLFEAFCWESLVFARCNENHSYKALLKWNQTNKPIWKTQWLGSLRAANLKKRRNRTRSYLSNCK